MNIVVDANIIFSSLIKEGKTQEIMINLSLSLYAPEFLFEEIEKHKEMILEKTRRSEEQLKAIMSLIKQIITVVPKEKLEDFMGQAKQISPDPDDVAYIALALKLKCQIWSNDKSLKQKQDAVEVYSTDELMKQLNLK